MQKAMQQTIDPTIQKRIVPLLSFIIFFSVLNGTMFNVAVPAIAEQFDLSHSEVSWVVAGYVIFFSIGSVTYGKLADKFPVKNLITAGLLIFSTGSLLGSLSQWYFMLVGGRMIQATGAAAIPALAMLVATRYFPSNQRGRVLGVIASTVAFGSGIGPIVGGFITGFLHWRYLFLISLMTLVTIPFFRKWLPEEETKEGRFDIKGALLMAIGIAGFLLFITQLIWWMLALSLVFLSWFVWHINKVDDPFIQPSLFVNTHFRYGLVSVFLAVGTVFGMMFMVPLMLKDVYHLSAEQIGLAMFPGAISAAILGTFGGKLADKKGSIPVVILALCLLMAGFLTLSSLAGHVIWLISLTLIINYVGFSFLQSSMANTVSRTLMPEQTGVGMGIYNLIFFMAGAFSFSIVGKILDYSPDGIVLNPLTGFSSATSYSNLFFAFILVDLISFVLFIYTFKRKQQVKAHVG
ncbi:MAG: MFS transporter [Bacillaceae bacterium]|nr:MFS transporter [Bacillaceae bacterium]